MMHISQQINSILLRTNDLSEFSASQFGLGLNYTDIFASINLLSFGLKSFDIKYSYYNRNTGLTAGIASIGLKFVKN